MSDTAGRVKRYVLQDGPTVNVAKFVDGNWNVSILTSGVEVVRASDYDALAAQAVELASVLREALRSAKITQCPSDYPLDHWLNRAQAVMDAQGRQG